MDTETPLQPSAAPTATEEKGTDRPFGLTPEEAGEVLTEIVVANNHVDKTYDDWQEAKEHAAELKGIYDAAVSNLSRLIKQRTAVLPLFDVKPKDGTESEDSRPVPLVDALLGVSSNILTKLAEAGLSTVGEMGDFTANGERLEKIKGIGPAGAEQIKDALDAFWARRSAAGKAVSVSSLL